MSEYGSVAESVDLGRDSNIPYIDGQDGHYVRTTHHYRASSTHSVRTSTPVGGYKAYEGPPIDSGMSGSSGLSTDLRGARENERRSLEFLNNSLVAYIEESRYLEAQNKILKNDIDALKQYFAEAPVDRQIEKNPFENVEMIDFGLVEVLARGQKVSGDVALLLKELDEWKGKWNDWNRNLPKLRAEIDNYGRDHGRITGEIAQFSNLTKISKETADRLKRENEDLRNKIKNLRRELEDARLNSAESKTRVSSLLQEVNTLIQETDVVIQKEIVYQQRKRDESDRKFFHDEIRAALEQIRADCLKAIEKNYIEIEDKYMQFIDIIIKSSNVKFKIDDYKDQLPKLRDEYTILISKIAALEEKFLLLEYKYLEDKLHYEQDLIMQKETLFAKGQAAQQIKDECENIIAEIERLCSLNVSLAEQIARYRKILENGKVTTKEAPLLVPTGIQTTRTSTKSLTQDRRSSASTTSQIKTSQPVQYARLV
ncbi:unnamed protein product [Caenorhabditis auriculariae]|uniref:IF rod domain-containing protein n=1 Tax=Caenorhabditis auriculariae TaxID=2777116 RepID=A0A8S1GZN8_9PELO|nr:unnamed protein product [Caenorhabditis auriculariae]